ncbi:hypothetical protein IFN73_09625 [Francisella tularensis subsp. holarctica]|nr:hypothetical protein [Francisella tularensis subsp. holarctica]
MKRINIIFAGIPDISAPVLKNLYKSQHNYAPVITQPDRSNGRVNKVHISTVKEDALANNNPDFPYLYIK